MTWSKVDDGLHAHVKPIRAGLEAMGLWVLCMSYCGFKENDGFIEREMAVRLGGGEDVVDRCAVALIGAGLWIERDGGWNFHDWHQYNPTNAQLEKERRKRAEAGRKGGMANKKRLLGTRFGSASPTDKPPIPSRSRPDPVPIPREKEENSTVHLPGFNLETQAVAPDPVAEAFAVWASEHAKKHPKSRAPVLDKAREASIKGALKQHSLDTVKLALIGIWRVPHNLGVNDRETEYTGIHIALQDADNIERFARAAESPPAALTRPKAHGLAPVQKPRTAEEVPIDLRDALGAMDWEEVGLRERAAKAGRARDEQYLFERTPKKLATGVSNGGNGQ